MTTRWQLVRSAPVAGSTWTVALDVAGTVKRFSHLVLAGESLEAISAALAAAVSADSAGNLSAPSRVGCSARGIGPLIRPH